MTYSEIALQLDQDRIWAHLTYLSKLDKLSGSPAARQASTYILQQLKQIGLPCHEEHFEEFLSNPITSCLTLSDGTVISSRPRPFSANRPEGVTGELVFDPHCLDKQPDLVQWEAQLESFRGKIVVGHGFDERYIKRLERHGVLGLIQVWESGEPGIHEDTASGVWGTPTQDSSLLLPTIPIAGISGGDGQALIQRLESQRLEATLQVQVETGVFPVTMPVADIPGRTDEFVLLSCHYDTWFLGATDNCAANATAIEMARCFWVHREELERGVRIVWWTGHSNGRYAGSTWYCDQHWLQLHTHCVAHITADLLGNRGANREGIHTTGAEGRKFFLETAAAAALGTEVDFFSIGRGADQSFWGTGIPFHFYSRSVCRSEEKQTATPGPGTPWWHTAEDTLDKVDPTVLARDARMFYLSAYRLAAERRLPFALEEYFSQTVQTLEDCAKHCDVCFDFAPVLDQVASLWAAVRQVAEDCQEEDARWNRLVRVVCGTMNRLKQSYGSPYDQDLAFSASGLFPRLCCVKGKRRETMGAEEYLFLFTDFIRQKNRMIDELTILTNKIQSF